jgi:hypothetical protein
MRVNQGDRMVPGKCPEHDDRAVPPRTGGEKVRALLERDPAVG